MDAFLDRFGHVLCGGFIEDVIEGGDNGFGGIEAHSRSSSRNGLVGSERLGREGELNHENAQRDRDGNVDS
jgi:hypothetical protein